MSQEKKLQEYQNQVEVTADELSLVANNLLNKNQLKKLFKKTPSCHVYERPAKGGGKWKFVTGTYVKKCLNLLFGWNWDFEILDEKFDLTIGQAYVKGRLTVRVTDPITNHTSYMSIIRTQFGRADIKFRKQSQSDADKGISRIPLDIGNDLKAATTDALKKCASELGIASDIYAPNEFKSINIVEKKMTDYDKLQIIGELLELEGLMITEDERIDILRIFEKQEAKSYDKAIKLLESKKPKKDE